MLLAFFLPFFASVPLPPHLLFPKITIKMSVDSDNDFKDDDFQDDIEMDSGEESDEFVPTPKVNNYAVKTVNTTT
jgi:hypothetical protein